MANNSIVTDEQPAPEPGAEFVKEMVLHEIEITNGVILRDMQDRIEEGFKRYGTYLQTFNGRSPLVDAYQEMLDAIQYLAQAHLETENDYFHTLMIIQIGAAALLKKHLIAEENLSWRKH